MSIAHLLFDAAVCIVSLLLIGYPLTRASRAIDGAERLPWALILGICVMIVYVRTVNSLVAIDRAMPFIAVTIAAWLAYHWRRKALRDLLAGDLRALNPAMSLCWLVALMLLVVALNVPVLRHHALLFEYSPNNDAIYYITNARWMLGHGFSEAVTYSADKPLFFIATDFFGKAPSLGRVGAEGLLSFVSALTGRDPSIHFQAMQAVGLVAGVAISALLLPRRVASFITHATLAGPLIIISVVFAPALIQIPINSSFSNAYGVVLMTAFVLISLRSPTRRMDILQPLLFAGLLATYPELTPISLVILGSVLLFELMFLSQSLREVFARGMRILAAVVTAAIVFPWISIFALMVLKTVYFVASTRSASWPDPYAGLSLPQLFVATLTTSRPLAGMLPDTFIIIVGVFLCLAIVRSSRRSRDTAFTCGVAFALLVFLGYIFDKEFNYGKLKILEYFSLFLAPSLIAACGFANARTGRNRLDQLLSCTALLAVVCMNIDASYLLLKQGIRTANNKYVAEDFIDTIRAADDRPEHRFLAVKFATEPYFYSMWASYFSHEPVLFSGYFGSGGYLRAFTDSHPAAPYDAATAVIADKGAVSFPQLGEAVLGHYGRFFLMDQKDSSQLLPMGLYSKAEEEKFSWMGGQLVLDINGSHARFVNLVLSNRFAAVANLEKISITVDNRHCEFSASTISSKLSIAIPAGKHHEVTITPTGRAVSPSALGQSRDSRILTYQVSGLALSIDATFQPVTCAGSP